MLLYGYNYITVVLVHLHGISRIWLYLTSVIRPKVRNLNLAAFKIRWNTSWNFFFSSHRKFHLRQFEFFLPFSPNWIICIFSHFPLVFFFFQIRQTHIHHSVIWSLQWIAITISLNLIFPYFLSICPFVCLSIRAMRSMNIIEYSIKNRVGTKFLRKFRTNYYAIFSYRFWVSKGVPFQKFEKETKTIAKISNKNVRNHCIVIFATIKNNNYICHFHPISVFHETNSKTFEAKNAKNKHFKAKNRTF